MSKQEVSVLIVSSVEAANFDAVLADAVAQAAEVAWERGMILGHGFRYEELPADNSIEIDGEPVHLGDNGLRAYKFHVTAVQP